ncbi:hypothetical protein M8A51_18160 [Schlegelella sp. S2-27]|uniref:Uncharacterized protein n=1 Tax=Caldimonas mangrovi TaxID=2944811 RepID=A0ABT0YRV6_9BURK|nr:hypothetical protein [Caldimonas mangrovi]MCM5681456.1 hypothetical protein [Caldimonas mangrovi]
MRTDANGLQSRCSAGVQVAETRSDPDPDAATRVRTMITLQASLEYAPASGSGTVARSAAPADH